MQHLIGLLFLVIKVLSADKKKPAHRLMQGEWVISMLIFMSCAHLSGLCVDCVFLLIKKRR